MNPQFKFPFFVLLCQGSTLMAVQRDIFWCLIFSLCAIAAAGIATTDYLGEEE